MMNLFALLFALFAAFAGIISENVGDGTWYSTGLGACGISNTDDQPIVAVSFPLFNNYPGATANPNMNPICGKKVYVTCGTQNVTVTITDKCEACKQWDLDFSPSAFEECADLSYGRIRVTWDYL